jgi:type II secretory pathway predicted ATPase ExeA
MFLDFYHMREQPFAVTPDPRYLYLGRSHREALASLFYGINTGRGFMALIAKPGMGKTTLLCQLLERLRGSTRMAFLFQTQCYSRELLRFVLMELGCDPGERDVVGLHARLKEVLIRENQAGKRLVLFIDEAQNLGDSVLETVRLLSDFETNRTKLVQIVLSGQPELATTLARPSLVQLRQRVSIVSRLSPLCPAEAGLYIDHRLKVAGYAGGPLFTPRARAMIVAQSKGIPRNINNLCFNALSLGYASKRRQIDIDILEEVVADLDLNSVVTESHAIPDTVAADPVASPPPCYRPREKGVFGRLAVSAVAASAAGFLLAGAVWFFSSGMLSSARAERLFATVIRGQHASKGDSMPTLVFVGQPNQTLREICRRYLGECDAKLIKKIVQRNPQIVDPTKIEAGSRIRVPALRRADVGQPSRVAKSELP